MKQFFTCFLHCKGIRFAAIALLFVVGVGNVWGGQYVYDFTSNDNWYTASTGSTHPTNGTDYTSFYDNRTPRVKWTLSFSND
ncbi:MAG: hypothetical protein IJQ18_03280 [Paludibacteraceae bacterium]|nr:hypothetical protein [Paludibacteraceae bacterium]